FLVHVLSLASLCLFFLLPRLPASPLFPYTTLFRSCGVRRPCVAGCPAGRECRAFAGRRRPRPRFRFPRCVPHTSPRPGRRVRRRDRKSTRLNSSHVKISYAVFCLKKKNQTKYSLR